MYPLSSLWIRHLFRKCPWIHYFFHEWTISSISFWRENYKFTFCFTNNFGIIFIFCEFTMNQLSFFEICISFAFSLWIHYLFHEIIIFFANLINEFSLDSLSASWFLFEFRLFFANSLSVSLIHYPFRDSTMNSLSITWFHQEYTMCFAILLWIHYLRRDFTRNSTSLSRIYYGNTIYFA